MRTSPYHTGIQWANEEVRVKMKAMGLDLPKQSWSHIFHNIFYAGYFSHPFLKVNGILDKAHIRGYETKVDKEYAPLLGSLKCPVCGHNLTASLSTKMRKRYSRDVGYYVCSRKNCKCNVAAKRVNEAFEEWADGIALPEAFSGALEAQLRKAFPVLNQQGKDEVLALKSTLSKKESEIERIEYNLATAPNAKVQETCSKMLAKSEAEKNEILCELQAKDKEILNLCPRTSSCLHGAQNQSVAGIKKMDKPSKMKICPVWLPLLDLNQRPSD